ncbi:MULTISPECIES: pyocin knob domain-containing protein [Achromobacter]|uniref:Pyocin knob domain-containing protein n=1 Tax=Achromobacter spanius TaxID=217203 RepID=A0ABY8GUA7_9BURK|nr:MULTISPECIES: pyocin knob domain-containing protein [Achromobacter]WAI82535.1 pyocin knob domain-containing protein [Achromobacter spanius]WEX92622.1 pyocin knob domain-containing protein [Achromobacter sp. SS2-2022]WFP08225.1 pyocin knob domain-containing protein [Achromobacter spanius]
MPIIETIKIGLEPNDGKGEDHRSAFQKVNLNFSALNTAIQGVLDTKGQANGFASLDGNGRLLAAQAPLAYAAVLPTSAHDLNDLITPGTYHQNTNVGAATGTHYPTPYAGLLLVRASATNFLYQFYTRFRSGPGGSQATYWRTFYSNVWSDWQEVAKKAELDALSTAVTAVQTVANAAIPIVQKGAASGVASLDSFGHLPAEQAPIMYAAVLPTATHTLNDYVTPGVWYQASIAGATAGGASYPTAQVGFLEVVATGTPVLQVFTTRNATPAIQQRFWRVRVTSTTWSNWKEVVDTTIAYTYQGGLASGVNLNDYTQRGTWVQASSAAAAAGINYPIAQSGYLSVLSAGYPGGTAATGCSQIYHAANSNRLFFRALVNSTWTDWVEVGRLDANGRIPNTQFPLSVSNPAGTDANNLTSPGLYYNNSDAQATAALNWPEQLAGSLFVEAAEVVAGSANQQITQTYTTRNGSGGVLRTYKRVRFGGGAGVWGLWQELARRADVMSHVYLTSATDANTLTADNTWWTAANSSVVSGGANFPPAPVASSFIFTTQAISATYMVQTCMMTPGSNRRPIEYRRIGSGSTTWSGWRIIAPVQLATDLPTADCGDVYVDGQGWYAWDGSAYKLTRAGMDHGQCRFLYVSTTQCRLVPQNGNGLIINGRQYRIPDAGVNIANTAGVNSIVQYVYAYDNAGAIALEASSTSHALHTDGVRIKSGDPSRTLVGMFIKPTNGEFVFTGPLNYVSSWFNRAQRGVQQYFNATTSSLNTAVILSNGVSFLGWAGDTFSMTCTGTTYANGSAGSYIALRVNGSGNTGNYGYSLGPGIGQQGFAITVAAGQATDNLYTVAPYGFSNVSGISVTWSADTGVLYTG